MPQLAAAQEAPGLVVMLEAAGRTIADLEERVAGLEELVEAERAERAALEGLLAQVRDVTDVRPLEHGSGETVKHDVAAPSAEPTAAP